MAVDPNDPRPQVEISTVGGVRRTEPRGPYVDQRLTERNLVGQVSEAVDPLRPQDRGGVKVYDAEGTQKSGFPERDPLPNSPNSWKPGRDYYANNGMVGQDFFRNSGS